MPKPKQQREHVGFDPDSPTAKNRDLVNRLKASRYTSRDEADKMEESTRAYERSVSDFGGGRLPKRSSVRKSRR